MIENEFQQKSQKKELPAATKDNYDLKVSKDGRVDIVLFKVEKIHWWQMWAYSFFLQLNQMIQMHLMM